MFSFIMASDAPLRLREINEIMKAMTSEAPFSAWSAEDNEGKECSNEDAEGGRRECSKVVRICLQHMKRESSIV